MIVVTGGCGFIGSAIVWRLNEDGVNDIMVVDHLGHSEKWKNLVPLKFRDYLDRQEFIAKLEAGDFGNSIEAIVHMGACSSTTETDADYLMNNNYRYTARLARWIAEHPECRFIYASSAATYGDGSRGYSDDEGGLVNLRPLNMYGYSKHLFDTLALREGWLNKIVGLKFFNVFGPNEGHKGDMRSVINKAYPAVRYRGEMTLFKSHNPNYADGEQKRDFIYVKDAIEPVIYFLNNRDAGGMFNVGMGVAHTWNEVASALFAATDKTTNVNYVSMPDELRDKYQYYTCAEMTKLSSTGFSHSNHSLEDAIRDYVHNYLADNATLGWSK